MATYYIDANAGDNKNDGLSENTAVADMEALLIKPGDTVLFKRGSFIRKKIKTVEGEPGKPVKYSAYGEGEMPTFCGSVNLTDEQHWVEESENIWCFAAPECEEAANLIFNKSDLCAALKWSKEDLCEQGDFFDNRFGTSLDENRDLSGHKIYLYSKENPAKFYSDIECAVCNDRALADNGHDVTFEGLRFLNGAVHGIAGLGNCRNLRVIGCSFEHIGGAVWNKKQKIRFGNGVEAWDIGENIEICGCWFNDIYDSATTQQGGKLCEQAKNFIIKDNVFIKCGMAAYEQRDRIPESAEFCNNICVDAGEGFSKLGEEMPRYSEIWPEPMGHHIFLWRIDKDNSGHLEIKNNIFYNAPYGAEIYSIIAKDAENVCDIENNTYYTENGELMNRWGGVNYKTFDEYKDLEKGCKYEKVDIEKLLADWKKEHIR